MRRAAFALLALSGVAAGVAAQEVEGPRVVLVWCGTLLAVPGDDPLSGVTLVVRDRRVAEVRSGYAEAGDLEGVDPEWVEVIDLRGSTVLPGLIDAHVHMTSEYSADVRLRRVQESDADAALRGAAHARRTLEAGFTTVRDLGSSGDSALALRDAIEAGLVPGPRLLVAGEAITPTGGHGDGTLGYREDLFDVPGAAQGIADGVAGARQAVRAQVKRGADVIKLTATGGVLSTTAAGTDRQFFNDELEAIVVTSRLLGRKVAAHAHGADGINAALRAGVDSIEHGTFLDETSIELFRASGAFLVPTILAGKTVEERAHLPGYFPPPVVEKALQVGPQIQEAFRRAHAAEVRIAFGTDSGVSRHGENAREFLYMVEAGMTPAEAIAAATTNAAELLGVGSEIGTLEPGKAADLIATRENPLVDVGVLQRVHFVMKGGVVYKR